MTTQPRRRKEIQALRGVAVIAVVLFHFFPTTFPYGFLGVDMFFIISGFVVTPLIQAAVLAQKEARPWTEFYKKRLFRLAPAFGLASVAIATTILLFQPTTSQPKQLMLLATAFMFLASPAALITENNYFASGNNPGIHLWSLSIEEQFYFLIPILILIVVKIFPNLRNAKGIKIILLISFSVSFGFYLITSLQINFWNMIDIQKPESLIFYLFPFRLWQFLLGSTAYYFTQKRNSKSKYTPLIILLPLLTIRNSETPNILVMSLAICFLTFIVCTNHGNFQDQNFTNRKLIWIGDASYSIYLFHMPLVVAVNETFRRFPNYLSFGKVSGIIFTIYLGRKSYEKIECKYRFQDEFQLELKKLLTRFCLFPLLIVIFALILSQNNYFSALDLKRNPQFSTGENSTCVTLRIRTENPCISNSNFRSTFALLGDSHAQSISKTIDKIMLDKEIKFYNYSTSGCPFILSSILTGYVFQDLPVQLQDPYCKSRNEWIENDIINNKFPQIAFASAIYYSSENQKLIWLELIAKTLEFLRINTENLIIIGPNPVLEKFSTDQYLIGSLNISSNGLGLFKLRELEIDYNLELARVAFNLNVQYLDQLNVFCKQDTCRAWSNSDFIFFDSGHLSAFGANYLYVPLSKIIN